MKRGTVIIGKRPHLPPMWRASVGLREKQPNRIQRAASDLAAVMMGPHEDRIAPSTPEALAFLAFVSVASAVGWILSAFRREK